MSAEVDYSVGAIWECLECGAGGGIGHEADMEQEADQHNLEMHGIPLPEPKES